MASMRQVRGIGWQVGTGRAGGASAGAGAELDASQPNT